MTLVLVISLVLILMNALFVAAEFALIASPRAALEHQAAGGNRFARRILSTLTIPHRQDRYVATAQLGITLASLGLGMYGEHALARELEHYAAPFVAMDITAAASTAALVILMLGHIVIGEMVPKGIALQHPLSVARFTYGLMQATLIVLYPLIVVSNGLARGLLGVLRLKRESGSHEQVYTPEELQLIVEESERGGALAADAGKILHELFEFGDLTAGEVMVPRVRIIGIPLGATPEQLRSIIVQHRRTRYAVYEGDLDHIVGMLHVKDLLRRLMSTEPVSLADVRRIPVVPETASLDDVLATMRRAQAHLAVVIDEHGGTAGIIALEDLFEEVVGDIDEGAPSAPPIADAGGGAVLVAGTVRLDELGQYLNRTLEHDEVDSVSGLILMALGRPPAVGDAIDFGGVHFEVTATSGRGVKEARASLLPSRPPAS
jgi:CBS domain containing-hemolysin-like protein